MRVQAAFDVMGLALVLTGCAQMERDKFTPNSSSAAPVAPPAPPAQLAPIAPVEPPAIVKDVRVPGEEVERLLFYFERLKRLPGGDLAKENEAARLAYGRAASDFNRLSYAIVLSLPGTSFNEDARALELLDPMVKRGEGSLRALAALLAIFIQERRRLGGDIAAVQQKLDALKSLERKLIERDQTNPGRK
ncbi:MAG TPA: hypothetical protein VK663_12465 [Burkholderiales bacterium]|nr:hypothetical protein [Burkholderiales bacterium]